MGKKLGYRVINTSEDSGGCVVMGILLGMGNGRES